MKEKSKIKIITLALFASFLWSTAFVAIKIGLNYSKPFTFAGMRFILSGLLLLPFCGKITNFFKTVISNFRMILLLAFLQTFVLYSFFFYAMTFTPGALGAIVIGSSPLITAITSHFFMKDDEMYLSKTLSLLIGITGVVILSISRKPWTAPGLTEFIGIILLLIGVTSSALGNIVVAKYKRVDPLILNSSQIFIGGSLLLLLSIPIEGIPEFIYPAEFYIALSWLSILSAVAFSIWFVLLTTPGVKVSELNVWKFIIPISGAMLSWLILPDEYPELMSVLGMVFIGGSIILLNFNSFRNTNSGKVKLPDQ